MESTMQSPLMALLLAFLLSTAALIQAWTPPEDKTKCPKVKVLRNFDLSQIMGDWYVVEYYASSEEAPEYSCMRAKLSSSDNFPGVFMNFNYTFTDDPDKELLMGNITWVLPDPMQTAHWIHAEDTYEGVYNTYVLDWDSEFALLLHCAEKTGETRYLSSLMLSRSLKLGQNVISFLREKLPKYDVDLAYMFPMSQSDCPKIAVPTNEKKTKKRKTLLKPHHKQGKPKD